MGGLEGGRETDYCFVPSSEGSRWVGLEDIVDRRACRRQIWWPKNWYGEEVHGRLVGANKK
jgi:hypothetical protein